MGKEGPCYHCGIDHTPLWRNGPPEKPVLCNACGSRWRTRGTLNDYTPKHAMREAQNCQTDELPATDTDQFAASIGGAKNNNSSSGSNDTDGPGEPIFENLPKRRRSVLDQFVLTPVERLCKQLYGIAHENPEMYFKKTTIGDVLIDQANNTTSTPQETTLGAMLLAMPPKQLKVVETEVSSVAKMITTVSTSTKDNGNHSAIEIGCDHGAHKDGDDHHTIEDDDDHGANKNGDRDTVEGGDDDSVTKNGGNHGT